MAHALKIQDESNEDDARASRADVAGYAADLLASLRRLSEANGMPLLAHLTDLARIEAVRNTRSGGGAP
jgi:hypothetical protein